VTKRKMNDWYRGYEGKRVRVAWSGTSGVRVWWRKPGVGRACGVTSLATARGGLCWFLGLSFDRATGWPGTTRSKPKPNWTRVTVGRFRQSRVPTNHCRPRGFAIHFPPSGPSRQAWKPVNGILSPFRFPRIRAASVSRVLKGNSYTDLVANLDPIDGSQYLDSQSGSDPGHSAHFLRPFQM